jgi:hypothetical protein
MIRACFWRFESLWRTQHDRLTTKWSDFFKRRNTVVRGMKVIWAIWRIEANGIVSNTSRIALSLIERLWSSARSSASGSFCNMALFRTYLYKFRMDVFGWKPLQLEKHDNWPLIHTAWDKELRNRAVKEPRCAFFLHDWTSYSKTVISHNHHKSLLLSPCGNYLTIIVRTGGATLRRNTLIHAVRPRMSIACTDSGSCRIERICSLRAA